MAFILTVRLPILSLPALYSFSILITESVSIRQALEFTLL